MMKAHGNEENDDIDRISSLPDEVCTHILSFVSTREAVQTCILSKRWINTWASVSDLKFDIKEFGLPEIIYHERDVEELLTKFELLVRSVLKKRETSCVNRFQLCSALRGWRCSQAIADCIGDVIKLGPRECLLEMSSCENLNLVMDVIFTCASLIYLELNLSSDVHYYVAIEPNSVNLPCLKTLKLDGVTINYDFLKNLLLGCSVLQELVLQVCYIDIIEICSNTLKKLVLTSYSHIKRVQIFTPNLLYFDMCGCMRDPLLLLNMPLLVHASIYIPDWYDQDIYITRGPKIIHSLSNVESLQLEFNHLEGKVLKKDFTHCSVFNNLKRLKLVHWFLDDFDLALFFLLHSPKLQELSLEYNYVYLEMECLSKETTQEGPRDVLVQREFLKTVRIVGFENDNELVDRLMNKLFAHIKIIGEIIF